VSRRFKFYDLLMAEIGSFSQVVAGSVPTRPTKKSRSYRAAAGDTLSAGSELADLYAICKSLLKSSDLEFHYWA